MKCLVLVVALAACSSQQTTAPQQKSPAPTAAPVAPANAGRVETRHFQSAALGVEKDYIIYLPAGYDASTKRYPVFYYLHGLGGNETNWTNTGELAQSADKLGLEAIVVMPDGDDGFYADSAAPIDYDTCMKDGTGLFLPGMQNRQHTCVKQRKYETYIIKDLVGEIDAKYRTVASREGRAIAGLSMGGFGALQLGMRHPDLFAAAASHSGVDALLYAGPYPYEKGKVKLITQEEISRYGKGNPDVEQIGLWIQMIFGKDIAVWKSYDPATLAEKVEPGKPALYLDCGTEDGFGLQNGAQYLHDILSARNIEHAFFLGPGPHDMRFWRPRLPESLKFLRDHTVKPT
ncbi:MAG TPA: alpha/beta hydrolase family protein [Kofleriaceae bacterium]|nr:alpha/beta hydrolase family protein [Kofleriaceae bacterium]